VGKLYNGVLYSISMRKKRVVSVFSILVLLGLGLAIFSLHAFGSLTGRVVDSSYSEELFSGTNYQFHFSPSNIEVKDGILYVEGNLKEIGGLSHQLQVTGYAFDSNGDSVNTFSKEIFLGSNGDLDIRLKMDVGNNDIKQVLLYFEDQITSVKVRKEFSSSKTVTGNVVGENASNNRGESVFPFILGVIILVSAILFVVSRVKQHNKQENFESLFASRTQRKYIDLDVR
jgi:hypothetical protein